MLLYKVIDLKVDMKCNGIMNWKIGSSYFNVCKIVCFIIGFEEIVFFLNICVWEDNSISRKLIVFERLIKLLCGSVKYFVCLVFEISEVCS